MWASRRATISASLASVVVVVAIVSPRSTVSRNWITCQDGVMDARSGGAERMARMSGPSLAAMLADLRPLGARSVIASTLLGANAISMPAERLVRAGELFGVADGAIRTALWRMVAAGELVANDGRYALAGPLLERRERFD